MALVLRQALSGEHRDYTRGSIRRAVILLSIPMILEMCMESVFAVVDIYFVGRLGKEAVATVGLTESVLAIVYSVAMGLGMAATAMVSRRVGEKNEKEAAHTAAQSILLSLGLTVVISLAGALLAPQILQMMGASPLAVQLGQSYTRIVFESSIVIMLLFLINGIFRGAGNASMAMWSLWVQRLQYHPLPDTHPFLRFAGRGHGHHHRQGHRRLLPTLSPGTGTRPDPDREPAFQA